MSVLRATTLPLLCLGIVSAAACGTEEPGALGPEPEVVAPGPDEPVSAIVSDPTQASDATTAGGLAMVPAAASGSEVVYVSLPPGSFTEGSEVAVTNLDLGSRDVIALVDGGFDPEAVGASAGATLAFEAFVGTRSIAEWREIVPRERPPIVVRTYPPPGKRDVPVSLSIVVVFSEPIDSTTLDSATVQLFRDGEVVPGRVEVTGDWIAEFTPSVPLAPGATYELRVTREVRDRDGESLESELTTTFTTVDIPPTQAVGYGSVVGVVQGSGTGYPWGTWAIDDPQWPPEWPTVWPVGISAEAAPGDGRFTSPDGTGSYRFDNLPAGWTTIRFNGMNPWPGVFPQMRLYADTAISVRVEPNRTVNVQDVVPRPVDPFIVVAVDHCPWGFLNPPTLNDWGACDSGYWGAPVDVQVDLNGVVGTPTSGQHYSFSIRRNQWFYQINGAVPGDYDVSIALAAGPVAWQLVPWQNSTSRLHLDRGLGYELFSFWYVAP